MKMPHRRASTSMIPASAKKVGRRRNNESSNPDLLMKEERRGDARFFPTSLLIHASFLGVPRVSVAWPASYESETESNDVCPVVVAVSERE
jgi:hypothetical protein